MKFIPMCCINITLEPRKAGDSIDIDRPRPAVAAPVPVSPAFRPPAQTLSRG